MHIYPIVNKIMNIIISFELQRVTHILIEQNVDPLTFHEKRFLVLMF